jgi:malonyl-CoA decarboxylase
MQIPFLGRFRRTDPPLDQAIALSQRLITRAGEADGTRVATSLNAAVASLDPPDLLAYFRWLVTDCGPPPSALLAAANAYVAEPNVANAAQVTRAAEPARQELLRRLNTAPGGTALIVGLRATLLGLLGNHPELEPLEADMRHLLASWFNRGFLELRRIDWHTPAAILEKLIAYEAVHAIEGWDDLRGRLGGDRRCYGFFHPALPEEPLIFIEVALTDSISDAIAPLLAHPPERSEPPSPTTAIFYSISNCQRGLRGISFGNFLIKQIAAELKAETPSLEIFATLSPVPGFRRWLDARGHGSDDDLAALCATYLTAGKADPVGAFHLANGARLERINLDADLSEKGRRQSYGVMVNYRYLADAIEANHEAFVAKGEVAVSAGVKTLRKRAIA